jgi:hypothetical protein
MNKNAINKSQFWNLDSAARTAEIAIQTLPHRRSAYRAKCLSARIFLVADLDEIALRYKPALRCPREMPGVKLVV